MFYILSTSFKFLYPVQQHEQVSFTHTSQQLSSSPILEFPSEKFSSVCFYLLDTTKAYSKFQLKAVNVNNCISIDSKTDKLSLLIPLSTNTLNNTVVI